MGSRWTEKNRKSPEPTEQSLVLTIWAGLRETLVIAWTFTLFVATSLMLFLAGGRAISPQCRRQLLSGNRLCVAVGRSYATERS